MHNWAGDSERQGRDGASATLRTQLDDGMLFAVGRRDLQCPGLENYQGDAGFGSAKVVAELG